MKNMIFATLILFGGSAFAGANTEFYYQPNAGQSVGEVQYQFNSLPKENVTNGNAVDERVTDNDVALSYRYGITEFHTVGFSTSLGSDKQNNANGSSTKSGLGDLHAFYLGSGEIIRYGANLGVSTGKDESDTRSSGGISASAHVGGLWSMRAWNYGADLNYQYLFERTYDGATASGKYDNGASSRVIAFTEYNYGLGFLGGQLAYTLDQNTLVKVDNGTTRTRKGEGVTSIKFSGTYNFNDMWTGLLSLGAGLHAAHDLNDTGSGTRVGAYTETNFMIGIRGAY